MKWIFVVFAVPALAFALAGGPGAGADSAGPGRAPAIDENYGDGEYYGDQGYEEGYDEGYDEGYEEGYDDDYGDNYTEEYDDGAYQEEYYQDDQGYAGEEGEYYEDAENYDDGEYGDDGYTDEEAGEGVPEDPYSP